MAFYLSFTWGSVKKDTFSLQMFPRAT